MALVKCPNCNNEISDKAAKCVHCGFDFNNSIKCPECGNLISKDEKICSKCGFPIEQEKHEETKEEKQLKKKKIDKKIIILSIVVLIIISIFGFSSVQKMLCINKFKSNTEYVNEITSFLKSNIQLVRRGDNPELIAISNTDFDFEKYYNYIDNLNYKTNELYNTVDNIVKNPFISMSYKDKIINLYNEKYLPYANAIPLMYEAMDEYSSKVDDYKADLMTSINNFN